MLYNIEVETLGAPKPRRGEKTLGRLFHGSLGDNLFRSSDGAFHSSGKAAAFALLFTVLERLLFCLVLVFGLFVSHFLKSIV